MRPSRTLVAAISVSWAVLAAASAQTAGPALPRGLPADLWELLVPPDSPVTPERVALGRKLYFDKRLSRTAPSPARPATTRRRASPTARPVSEGIGGKKGARNAPTTLNAVFNAPSSGTAARRRLEEQAKLPIINPIEMGMPSRRRRGQGSPAIPEYQDDFQKRLRPRAEHRRPRARDRRVRAHAGRLGDAPFDRFIAGDKTAISDEAQARLGALQRQGALQHLPPVRQRDPARHRQQVPQHRRSARDRTATSRAIARQGRAAQRRRRTELALQTDLSELGRFVVDRASRRTSAPSRRRSCATSRSPAPYMHDGREATLWDVMDHYNKGGEANPYLDGGIEPLALTEPEIDRTSCAFMDSLTERRATARPRAPRSRSRSPADGRRAQSET